MTPRKVRRQQLFLSNFSLRRMRKKDAHFLPLQGLSLNGVWICPENPRGKYGLEKCRKLGPGLPTHKAQTDSRSCSVVLRLCSLVSQNSQNSESQIHISRRGLSALHWAPTLPPLHGEQVPSCRIEHSGQTCYELL